MNKSIFILFFILCSITSIYGQTPGASYLESLINPNTPTTNLQFSESYIIDSIYCYPNGDSISGNHNTKFIFENYNSKNNWEIKTRFDIENEMEELQYENFNIMDNAGNVSETYSLSHFGGDTTEVARTYFQHDANGMLQNTVYTYLDWITTEWVKSDSIVYEYENNYLSQSTGFYYIATNDTYVELSRVLYTRDSDGNLLEINRLSVNAVTQTTTNLSQSTYSLNPFTNQVDTLFYRNWDETTNQWSTTSRTVYNYNNGLLTDYFREGFAGLPTFPWIRDQWFHYTYYPNTDRVRYEDHYNAITIDILPDYIFFDRTEYFHSANPLDIKSSIENEVELIMKNPFVGNPEVSLQGIQGKVKFIIYDMNGIKVFDKTVQSPDSFTLNTELPASTYLINVVENNNIIAVKKIVKLR